MWETLKGFIPHVASENHSKTQVAAAPPSASSTHLVTKSKHRSDLKNIGKREPPLLAQALRDFLATSPDSVKRLVDQSFQTAGHLLDDETVPAYLVNPMCLGCPIVGASVGFTSLTGYSREDLLGKNPHVLLEGVPEISVSKSGQKNVEDFFRMCRQVGVTRMSEISVVQPHKRPDGSTFVSLTMYGMSMMQDLPYVICVPSWLCEGFVSVAPSSHVLEVAEQARCCVAKLRCQLCDTASVARESPQGSSKRLSARLQHTCRPPFRFWASRLQDRCLLLNDGFTAMRREPHELGTNCIVVGDTPVRRTNRGLYFAITVDDVVQSFQSLPVLGFTRRKPVDEPCCYPSISRYMGESVLIGAACDAFARDSTSHFDAGVKRCTDKDVQVWSVDADVPMHQRTPPRILVKGDRLGCLYTNEGFIQMWCNGKILLSFDVKRPIPQDSDHYAVVDVCFTPYRVTLIHEPPPQTEFLCETVRLHKCETSPPQLESITKLAIETAIKAAVTCCPFPVTVADPSRHDAPLIAVSKAFEQITGYTESEVLGSNCRFLRTECRIDPEMHQDLRISCATGAHFVGRLENRHANGDKFINLVELQGLRVARGPGEGGCKSVWYLVAFQVDVTLSDPADVRSHLEERSLLIQLIRKYMQNYSARTSLEEEEPTYMPLDQFVWISPTAL